MEIKIDKGIPAPDRSRAKYPLAAMELGDSFFVPGKTAALVGASFARHAPKKFAARGVTENGVKGVRVWRIK